MGYLIEGLSARGIDNVLVCARGHALARTPTAAETVELPMGGDWDVGMVRRLRRLFSRVRPDLIHVQSRRGADLFGGLACLADKWTAVLTRRVDNPEPSSWARFKYRPYRVVVSISRAVEAELLGNVGLAPSRVRRIPSAVDTERFAPDKDARARLIREFQLPDNAFIIGVSAQLIPRKGHGALLDCLPELVARHRRIRVLCFGQGPLQKRLCAKITSGGLQEHVKLVGFREDIAELLPGLDLLAHPAEREGMGVALLEAMSCAVPVVASAVGGIIDVINSGIDGVLVPSGGRSELSQALERMIVDEHRRGRMGQAARARVQQDFSVELMTSRYLDIYRTVHAHGHATV